MPKYAPQAMEGEFDSLGEDQWELVSIQPVADVGRNGDISFQRTETIAKWSNYYFAVFKRSSYRITMRFKRPKP
jgi:hypothetical protein